MLKVFEVLKGIQDEEILDGTIYLDEMYLSKIKSETIKKDGKKLRGISNNKIGIGVDTNKEKSHTALVTKLNLVSISYSSGK